MLGAGGQIARGLVADLPQDWTLDLFSRNPALPRPEAAVRGARVLPYDNFAAGEYDLVINAAGPGDPSVHRANGAQILRITESFDNMVTDFIGARPATGYINLSTGAVYGADYGAMSGASIYGIDVDDLASTNAYVLAKIAAEAKHRQSPELKIADLRIFGYFSRRIDLESGFFMAQVAAHLREDWQFRTGPSDFVRDFIAPEDLAAHIVTVYESGVPNAAFNAISAAPVTKFEILEALGERFGLRYSVAGGEPVRKERPRAVARAQEGIKGPVLTSRITSMQVVLREIGALCSGAD
jgi:hypothetical protein